MPNWFSKEPAIPFMAKIEKSEISYTRDILCPNGNYLSQIDLQQKCNIYINFLDYMTIVRNIKKKYKETTLYPFESPHITTIIEHLGMSMKGCTHIYTLLGNYDNKLESKIAKNGLKT